MKISKKLKFLLLPVILSTPIIVSSILATSKQDFSSNKINQATPSTYELTPIGKTVNEADLNRITIPGQYFNNISTKFSYDFVELFKTNVINELKTLIRNNKDLFFENSSSITRINDFIQPVISTDDPNFLTFQASLDYNNNMRTSITIKVEGFCVRSTVLADAARNYSVARYNELSTLIPKEIVEDPSKKEILVNFLSNNLEQFFNYIPKKANIKSIIPTLDPIDDRALNLTIYVAQVSDNGYYRPKPSEFSGIKLVDFSKPQKPTSAKSITAADLYRAQGINNTKAWQKLERKYVNDFVIDGEFKEKALTEIEAIINNQANKSIFFDNPVPYSNAQPPIVKPGSLEFLKNDQDLGTIIIAGSFLSINENPNNTNYPYLDMQIQISGFRKDAGTIQKQTSINISQHPVLGKILAANAPHYINEIVGVLKESLTIDQDSNSDIFEYQSYYTKLVDTPQSISDIRVAVIGNKIELSNVRIAGVYDVPPSTLVTKNYNQISLDGFQNPEQNNTIAKEVSIIDLAGKNQEFNEIKDIWTDQILLNINGLQNNARLIFEKFINSNPEWFFTNHVNNAGMNMPYIKEGTLINFDKAKDQDFKYTKLLIKGTFLTKPSNPNDAPIYKEHTITITNFKNTITESNPNGYAIDDSLKDITLDSIKESPENIEKIRSFIQSNFSKVLLNIIDGYTTFKIATDNAGRVQIEPNIQDPSQAVITIDVENYVSHDCSIVNNQIPKQFRVFLNGFAVKNESITTPKAVDAKTIARNQHSAQFPILKDLDKKFAQDLVTSGGFKGEPGIKSAEFINEIVKLINITPELFFYQPAEDSSPEKPYVKPNSELTANLTTEGGLSNIELSGYFLRKAPIQGNPSVYSDEKMKIIIAGLNVNQTTAKPTPISIVGYTYNPPQQENQEPPFVPSTLTINEFLRHKYYQDALKQFIKAQLFNIFDNISYRTQMDENTPLYSTPKQDIDDPTVLNVSVQLVHYVNVNGYIDITTRPKPFEFKIKGFKQPPLNDKTTTPKADITSFTLSKAITQEYPESSKFQLLKDLSKYQAWEYTTDEGLKNSDFVNEFMLSIKSNPEIWFDNPVDVTNQNINPRNLPILKENESIIVGIEQPPVAEQQPATLREGEQLPTPTQPAITITSSFLTQPDRVGVVVTEKDYKKLTIKITNSPEIDFWTKKATSLNPFSYNIDDNDENLIPTLNINDSWVLTNESENTEAGKALYNLKEFNFEEFANNPNDRDVRNNLLINIKKVLNSSLKNIFINIIRKTSIKEINEWDVDQIGALDAKNNRIFIKLGLDYTIDRDGNINSEVNRDFPTIAISGFGSNINKELSKKNENLDTVIIVLSTICASIILIFSFLFFRLYRKRKDLRLNDKQWEDFK